MIHTPPPAASAPSGGNLDSFGQARQRLLFMCTCCEADSQMRYHSAALFEEVLSLLRDGAAAAPPADTQADQLLAMACACMLLAAGAHLSPVVCK